MAKYVEDEEDSVRYNKNWANDYILGPLHDIEPHQESATRLGRTQPTTPSKPAVPDAKSSRTKRESRSKKSDAKDGKSESPTTRRVSRRESAKRSSSVKSEKRRPVSPPTPPARKSSTRYYPPSSSAWTQGVRHARCNSVGSSQTANQEGRQPSQRKDTKEGEALPRRRLSLAEKHAGDLSVRPLAAAKKDHETADKHGHRCRRRTCSDLIDSLDLSGPGVYHHDGPFDAVLASRNVYKKYSPLEAVKHSNREALRATPREYIWDSLAKHNPLQGTGTIAPGKSDMTGRIMRYTEGVDLMRDPDAPGGPYKRWPGIAYLDEDLKGKGEPSYTFERERKEQKARLNKYLSPANTASSAAAYEMQPRSRQRSASHVHGHVNTGDGGLRRSNTTGRSMLQGVVGSRRRSHADA